MATKKAGSTELKADPEQLARFIEAARELGCDDDRVAFEKRFISIVPPHQPGGATAAQARDAKGRARAPKRRPRDKESSEEC